MEKESGIIRKAKMGKKSERSAKDKLSIVNNEEEAKSADDYQCTGNLEQDFTELCNLVGFMEIPRVIIRERTPLASNLEKGGRDESDSVSEKDPQEALSIVLEKFTYFKPSIQVDTENDDPKSAREVYIRGWKIDERMLGVLTKCLPALSNLQEIRLWNVALTDATFGMFIGILPRCTHLKTLVLDGNPLEQQPYHKLITEDVTASHLVLRNNKIDDEGAKLIGQALSNLKLGHKSLVSLNLSYNHIGNEGAGSIAEGLRRNRSLLWLDLSHNRIKDEGATKLAEVLGHFSLTHKEVVEQRQLLMAKEVSTKTFDTKTDRPQSHQSSTGVEKGSQLLKQGRSASNKKYKETSKKDEKPGTMQSGAMTSQSGQSKKEDLKGAKKQLSNIDQKTVRGRGPKSARDKRPPAAETENLTFQATDTTLQDPLLEPAEHRDGQVFMPGNKVLISLNLTRNQITEQGLKAFLMAIETQTQETKQFPGTKIHIGLLRLAISKNNFPENNETFLKIQELMMPRDPLLKTIFQEDHAATS
ncbi:leucine-rich repeat-containing protein 71 isoform X2 [Pleurodeles waltl]|uniref:leucine-rich repeat-containing protein 71 isoform X2 n=1 Tax=Pleurodeles waltl TaxID=8319 RepID=UPI0037099E4C